MNNRERFGATMRYESVDRLPIIEWASYWDKTTTRWHKEGLPEHLQGPADIRAYFDLDRYLQYWIPACGPTCPAPASYGGGILRTPSEYQTLLEHLYPKEPFDRAVIEEWAAEQARGDAVIWISLEGFFWHPRKLLGIENHFYAFGDAPDLMQEMNHNLLDHNLRALDQFCAICKPDFMTFAEDMSYNKGPMLSKTHFDEFLAPYYREIVPELKKRDIIPFVDSDGDVLPLIPWLKDVGIEGILPLERMAGIDVAQIRREHPTFLMIGAFDKMKMHLGDDAIRSEFERLLPTIKTGGFIPSVDHQTPPEVSLEQYRTYLRLLREYAITAAK